MELLVKRVWPVDGTTIGTLEADGQTICFTLEDQVREISGLDVAEWKVDGQTAIPRGRYKVIIDFSDHFQRMLPHILDVPGFIGIRIHGGNRSADTEGCVLVGEKRIDDQTIAECAPALDQVMELLHAAIANQEETWITLT